jgi:hypothetical protein
VVSDQWLVVSGQWLVVPFAGFFLLDAKENQKAKGKIRTG